jgi:hypothetical protein
MRPGDEFTAPGTPWAGRTVFCLASGDSLRRVTQRNWVAITDMQSRGAVVLSVNSSIKTARAGGCEPDAIFFTDTNWFEDNLALIEAFQGRVFTVDRRAKAAMPLRIERIENVHRPDFVVGHPPMRDGRSSGHRAVSLAIMCGAMRVILLGYDMQVDPVSGRSHCHDDYQHTEPPKSYAQEFIPSFTGWHVAALAVGVEVLNATERSALMEFPMVDLAEVFACSV